MLEKVVKAPLRDVALVLVFLFSAGEMDLI